MCVIITLKAGQEIPFEQLQNAVWNNPHGYGLVVHINDDVKVIKGFDEKGTDPVVIRDLLDKYKGHDRQLHLRWKTEGDLTEENVQPFLVYDKGDNQVWFMHNGTLYDYKPQTVNGVKDSRSDSKIFADRILEPLLRNTKGEYADINGVLQVLWGKGSRGLLVSNFQADLYLNPGDWKTITVKNDGEEDTVFYASNDSYFNKLERGFEFERRKAEAEAAKKKEESKSSTQSNFFRDLTNIKRTEWGFTKLKDIDFSSNRDISEEIGDFFDDVDLWTDEGMASLRNMTHAEVEMMVETAPTVTTGIFLYLSSAFGTKCDEANELKEKNKKAENMIAELKQRLEKAGL